MGMCVSFYQRVGVGFSSFYVYISVYLFTIYTRTLHLVNINAVDVQCDIISRQWFFTLKGKERINVLCIKELATKRGRTGSTKNREGEEGQVNREKQ